MLTIEANRLPDAPKIYHITHLNNLPSLSLCGCLWSDAMMLQQEIGKTAIGMPEIKRRRLEDIAVACHPHTMVGEYVPFYFCPRSVMLIKYYYNNDPNLPHREGQRPIVHLEADMREAVEWADKESRRWAFTTSNAGAFRPDFFHSLDELHHINWEAVRATDFREAAIQEGKQAEFLLYESFPWFLVKVIGVKDANIAEQVKNALTQATHIPEICVKPEWYF